MKKRAKIGLVLAVLTGMATVGHADTRPFCNTHIPNGILFATDWDARPDVVASCNANAGQSVKFYSSPKFGVYKFEGLTIRETPFYFLADEIRVEGDKVYLGSMLGKTPDCAPDNRVYIPANGITCAFRPKAAQ